MTAIQKPSPGFVKQQTVEPQTSKPETTKAEGLAKAAPSVAPKETKPKDELATESPDTGVRLRDTRSPDPVPTTDAKSASEVNEAFKALAEQVGPRPKDARVADFGELVLDAKQAKLANANTRLEATKSEAEERKDATISQQEVASIPISQDRKARLEAAVTAFNADQAAPERQAAAAMLDAKQTKLQDANTRIDNNRAEADERKDAATREGSGTVGERAKLLDSTALDPERTPEREGAAGVLEAKRAKLGDANTRIGNNQTEADERRDAASRENPGTVGDRVKTRSTTANAVPAQEQLAHRYNISPEVVGFLERTYERYTGAMAAGDPAPTFEQFLENTVGFRPGATSVQNETATPFFENERSSGDSVRRDIAAEYFAWKNGREGAGGR